MNKNEKNSSNSHLEHLVQEEHWAFICYAGSDHEWASWLYENLYEFKVPKCLHGSIDKWKEIIPSKIGSVYLDREDLHAGPDHWNDIKAELERSKTLIVICSPRLMSKEYVDNEIRYFKSLGKGNRIICVIIEGEPNVKNNIDKQRVESSPIHEYYIKALKHPVFEGKTTLNEDKGEKNVPVDLRLKPGEKGWASISKYQNSLQKERIKKGFIKKLVAKYKEKKEEGLDTIKATIIGASVSDFKEANRKIRRKKKIIQSLKKQIIHSTMACSFILAGVGLFYLSMTASSVLENWQNEAGIVSPELVKKTVADKTIAEEVIAGIRKLSIPQGKGFEKRIKQMNYVFKSGNSFFQQSSHKQAIKAFKNVISQGKTIKAELLDFQQTREEQLNTCKRLLNGIPTSPYMRTDDELKRAREALAQCKKVLHLFPDNNDTIRFKGICDKILAKKEKGKNIYTFDSHSGVVNSVAITPDGRYGLSGSEDSSVKYWDLSTGKCIYTLVGHAGGVLAVDISNDGKYGVSGGGGKGDGSIRLWNLTTGERIRIYQHGSGISNLRFSPDGKSFASSAVSAKGSVTLWNIKSKKYVSSFKTKGYYTVSICFSPDGNRIISGSNIGNGAIEFWDLIKNKKIKEISKHNPNFLQMTSDGNYLISVENSKICLWSMSGNCIKKIDRGRALQVFWGRSASMSSNAEVLLTGMQPSSGKSKDDDTDLWLWNLNIGAPVLRLHGHTEDIRGTAMSANGQYALSASKDNTVRFWFLGKSVKKNKKYNDNRNVLSQLKDEIRNKKLILKFSGAPKTFMSFITCKNMASKGDASAMCNLGVMYALGNKVKQDYKQASDLLRASANKGSTTAMYNLGILFSQGHGKYKNVQEQTKNEYARVLYDLTPDKDNSVKWFYKATKSGNVDAMYALGKAYYQGKGVGQNYTNSAYWFKKSADNGNIDGMYNMGLLMCYGRGVSQSFSKGMEWFQKATKKGDTDAMYCIGVLYKNGCGVPQDNDIASKWLTKAKRNKITDSNTKDRSWWKVWK